MPLWPTLTGLALVLVPALARAGDEAGAPELERAWAQWRGPLSTGVAPWADPPLTWSERSNVRWKRALPGLGHSSPIVFGERVFVTSAVPFGDAVPPVPDDSPGAHDNAPVTRRQRYELLALRRADGELVWSRALREELPHEGAHASASLASASPVTDGELVFAFFGSRGLYCVDVAGEPRWSRDLGRMQVKHGHGEGASPALHGDTLVINWDHEGDSFLLVLDKRTGEPRWRVARDEETSWATPIVVEHGEQTLVVVSGTRRLCAYDLADGALVWECAGLSHNVVASPVAGDGMVFAASSYEKQALLAIRLEGAKGDVSVSDRVAWTRRRRTPYVPSPLLYDGALYLLHHYQGVLSRVVAATGEEPRGPFRLGIGDVYASPVAAAGRVYVTDREGATVVLSAAEEPAVLAVNRLEDRFSASAALAGRELFLRGERYLYCIADK